MRIILGVSGGIAAYKACSLLRLLREAGHSVRVIPTKNALRFVGAATWEALSGEPVSTSVFDDIPDVAHVELGKSADLVIVAPATADLLARAAAGRANDLLTATLLVATCPVVFAPAMHTQMWQHPATVANVALLRERGILVIDPNDGRLTGTDSGLGRLPDPEAIAEKAMKFARDCHAARKSQHPEKPNDGQQLDSATTVASAPSAQNDGVYEIPKVEEHFMRLETTEPLAGKTLVVTAGGTREPIDPVRWIGNRSSGKQGIAIAASGVNRGMVVTLIAANIDQAELAPLRNNSQVHIIEVETCLEMLQAVREVRETASAIVMAAAVADYRPLIAVASKVKKQAGDPQRSIELIENPDILAELCRQRLPGQVIVGFAAETGDVATSVLDFGRAKAQRKGADLLVVNDVSQGQVFGTNRNQVWLLDKTGEIIGEAKGSKREVAEALLTAIADLEH